MNHRLRRLVASTVFGFGLLGAAAAFAADVGGVRMLITGNNATLAIDSFAMTFQPTQSDLRRIVDSATFPVVLPVGIPQSARILFIAYSPKDHPTFLSLSYARPDVGFSIVDTLAIERNAPLLKPGEARVTATSRTWTVGKETVVVLKRGSSSPVVDRVQSAMASATTESSLQANAQAASPVVILPHGRMYGGIAQKYVPANSGSVLLWGPALGRIAQLAKDGKPMPDTHTFYLLHVPALHGEPDYSKATIGRPVSPVISTGGVRAMDAMLRATRTTPKCNCVVLFSPQRGSAYAIWKIDIARPNDGVRYSVNARTLKVTSVGRR